MDIYKFNRKFILNSFCQLTKISIWDYNIPEQLNILNDKLLLLQTNLNKIEISTEPFSFSPRQKFIFKQLDLPTSEIENKILEVIKEDKQFNFIGDSFHNFYDFFHDYNERNEEPINQEEVTTIKPIIEKYITVCNNILHK